MSNRLTFSLASLIFLIAFGLVFGTTSVMAHDASEIANLRAHNHPTLALPAKDLNGDDDTEDAGEAAVSAHNIHPVLESITLKSIKDRTRDDMVVITADTDGDSSTPADGLGNNQFILVVDFNIDIVNTNTDFNGDGDTSDTGEIANSLATNEVTRALWNSIQHAFSADDVEVNAVTVDPKDDSKFEVKITIDPDSNSNSSNAIPNGTADDPLEKLYLRVQIASGAVLSVSTSLTDPQALQPVIAVGQTNTISSVYVFEIVKSLVPLATMTPTKTENTDGTIDVTFTSSKAVTGVAVTHTASTGLEGYTVSDLTSTGNAHKVTVTLMEATRTQNYAGGTITFTATYTSEGQETTATYTLNVPARNYHPAPSFTTRDIANIKIWAMTAYESPMLPKARLAEQQGAIGYKLRPVAKDNEGAPHAPPAGSDVYADDSQDRYFEVKAANKADSVAMKATDYEYVAYNMSDPMKEDTLSVSIEVVAQKVPTAPTMVVAAEEGLLDAAGMPDPVGRTINNNHVMVTWVAPDGLDSTMSAPHDKIPFGAPITHYEVNQTGPTAGSAAKNYPADDAATTKIDKDATSYKTPRLANTQSRTSSLGEYTFKVRAVNAKGNGAYSDAKDADVLNPPDSPRDLRAVKTDTAANVGLNWLEPTDEGDADGGLADNLITDYQITVVDPNGDDTRFESGSAALRTLVEDLAESGRYVFRVAAINKDGVGPESLSTNFSVDLPPDAGTNPNAPTFGDATIASITATVGQAISGVILPEATDTDTGDTLTYSITPDLPDGLTFDATTRALTGTPEAEKSETVYTYTVMDRATGGKSDSISFFITVNAAGPGPATPATSIASKGYAVFVPSDHYADALPNGLVPHTEADMPDLSEHFVTGGTIDVIVTGGAKHDLIITEIMVAEDLGRVGQTGMMRPEAGQWIEVYNTTAAAINVADITIAFSSGYPAGAQPTGTTDRFSNIVAPGWGFEAAFKDALSGQTAINAAGVVTVTKMFKSLRRVHKDNKPLQNAGTVIQNGWAQGSWALTADSRVFLAGRVGTPGSENRPSTFAPATFTAPLMNMTINEVANKSDNSSEWVELKGPAGGSLRKVKISKVTAIGTETTIYQFPDNDDVKFPSNGILLITDQNPLDNALSVDLENGVPKEGIRYRIRTLVDLPNDGNFLLVLRNKDGKIEDVAGHATDLSRNDPYTTLWPLAGNVGRIGAKNKLEVDKVYHRVRAIQGYSHNKDKPDETAFAKAGFTGIGYDRNASNSDMNGGTPGYPNNAYINSGDDATKKVIISEIMYSQGERGNLAQWIELQNLSPTTGVDLHNWRLYIVNHDNPDFNNAKGKVTDEIWLRNMKIPPLQTALIVSRAGRNTTNLPSHRVLNLRRNAPLLSSTGFELKLEAKSNEGDAAKRQAGDIVSNLVSPDADPRRANDQAFTDPVWALPSGMDENGDRVSIARRTSSKLMVLDGKSEWHWKLSNEDTRTNRMNSTTYYGHVNDIGSPGQTVGGVLPVSLSKFRPERLDDGSIVVRWITESETNNAGFNILRGEALDGEFTKLNTQLIKGQGTTSERTAYEFTDKSAKPNVKYYYQIQDVSLDGDVVTLRTTHLRGNVNAAGKATTTWGELKALQ